MSLAYFRMKFSSEKMNRDLVFEDPRPGSVMSVARLATFRKEFSWLPGPPSSLPPPSITSVAILEGNRRIG